MKSKDAADNPSRWDERYRLVDCLLGTEPTRFLADRLALIQSLVPGRRACDIACGEGRNSIFLARAGFQVVGLDISGTGLAKGRQWMAEEGLTIDFRQTNLAAYDFVEQFDLIINCNFLLRELIPKAVAALSTGGIMLFDTLLDSPYVPNKHTKEFLLQPGELARIFAKFPGEILEQQELLHDQMPTAKLLFRKH